MTFKLQYTVNENGCLITEHLVFPADWNFEKCHNELNSFLEKEGILLPLEKSFLQQLQDVQAKAIPKGTILIAPKETPSIENRITKIQWEDFAFQCWCLEMMEWHKYLEEWVEGAAMPEVNTPSYWVELGQELFFKPHEICKKDIYAKVGITPNELKIEIDSDSIKSEMQKTGVLLVAQKSGYLICDELQQISILESAFYNEKNTKKNLPKIKIKNPNQFKKWLEKNHPEYEETKSHLVLQKGVDPVYSVHQTLELLFQNKIEEGSKEAIDYKNWSPYFEIKKGERIAILHKGVEESQGVDLFGKKLEVEKQKKISFLAGEGVEVVEDETSIEYRAEYDGILCLEKGGAFISKVLSLETGVNLHTGNINYSGSVVVQGDVEDGFSVECGETLFIHGTVGRGCSIRAEKDIFIDKGVFSSKIQCKGNIQAEFLSHCQIWTKKSLLIKGYVEHSHVFAKSKINVGTKVYKSSRAAVLGGVLNALDEIDVLSVGGAQTILACGFDYEKQTKIEKCKIKQFENRKHILQLQEKIPSKEKLMNGNLAVSPEEKTAIKKNLLLLKDHIELQESLRQKMVDLKAVIGKSLRNYCKINIRQKREDDVVFCFPGKQRVESKKEEGGWCLLYKDNIITQGKG